VVVGGFVAVGVARPPVRAGAPLEGLGDAAPEYTAEEEAGIAASLRGLGYIE
jgi:hypothetical protein